MRVVMFFVVVAAMSFADSGKLQCKKGDHLLSEETMLHKGRGATAQAAVLDCMDKNEKIMDHLESLCGDSDRYYSKTDWKGQCGNCYEVLDYWVCVPVTGKKARPRWNCCEIGRAEKLKNVSCGTRPKIFKWEFDAWGKGKDYADAEAACIKEAQGSVGRAKEMCESNPKDWNFIHNWNERCSRCTNVREVVFCKFSPGVKGFCCG